MTALALQPEPAQPIILTARCIPPKHGCQAVYQRALHRCLPALIVHLYHDRAAIKLVVSRPWELTPLSRDALHAVFEMYGSLCDSFDGARARLDLSGGLWEHLPLAELPPFLADVAAHLVFQRVVLS